MIRKERERTAAEWFALAHRAYIESHQGCARCAAQHCVFRSRWNRRIEYHCTACDFSASNDELTGQSSANLGEGDAFPQSWVPEETTAKRLDSLSTRTG